VSNKIGSLCAAVMAKREENVRVVVVSEVDKIVATDMEEGVVETHPASELMGAWAEQTRNGLEAKVEEGVVEVYGEWFEWVPAEYVDVYVTEIGELRTEDVEEFSRKIGELKGKIFRTEMG
jgi:translation initiation factor 2B subunit (eIF-2B alpha/beta/delta family)